MKKKKPGKVLNIRDVPDDLHRELRIWAARRDLNLREAILRLVQNAVAEDRQKEKEEALRTARAEVQKEKHS